MLAAMAAKTAVALLVVTAMRFVESAPSSAGTWPITLLAASIGVWLL